MRKIFIILLVVALVVGGVYFFYIRPKVATDQPLPNVLKPFFPAVTSSGNSFGSDDTSGTTPTDGTTVTTSTSALKQLTGNPIAGYTIYTISTKVSVPSLDPKQKPTIQTTTDYYLRYVSRANGYVYEIKNESIPLQVTNIFIPNIYEAYFADTNNTALLRFLRPDNQTIATYSVPIPVLNGDGTRTQVAGTYLPDDIFSLAVSPDQSRILRITTDTTGAVFTTSTSKGTVIKNVFKSPFTSWLAQWSAANIYLQTKPASIAEGYMYALNQTTSQLTRIVGNIKGLTTSVSPSGAYVLYSESTNTGFNTKLLNTKTGTISNINLSILPEKCAWLRNDNLICAGNNSVANAVYPDAWYAGITHFNDELYRINTSTNTYSMLFDGGDQSIDMTNLQVDEDNGLVYFIDKNTGLLWQYKY
jgi:hypothetical protein